MARLERFGELFGVGIVWVLIAYFALFTFWALFPRGDRTNGDFLLGLLFWTLLCYALNLMAGWAPKNLFIVLPASRHPPKRLEAISVPKTDVLSWSRLDHYSVEAPASAASAPAGIATFLNAEDKGSWLRAQCGQSPADAPAPEASASRATSAPASASVSASAAWTLSSKPAH